MERIIAIRVLNTPHRCFMLRTQLPNYYVDRSKFFDVEKMRINSGVTLEFESDDVVARSTTEEAKNMGQTIKEEQDNYEKSNNTRYHYG